MKKEEIPTPLEIKDYLDQYVIGQDDAKLVLSVGVYNHYKKLLCEKNYCPTKMDKSNILMLGETGCGKTLLVKTIAQMLEVPYYIQDCTKITESGYVGSDVEDCLVGLLRNAQYDIPLAERGIVVLDEVDKLAAADAGPSITRDVGGTGVQQALLKIVEGDIVGVPPQGGRKHPEQALLHINTKNILFIATGAFVGLDRIVKNRTGVQQIGYGKQPEEARTEAVAQVTPQDLFRYGMIPEFVGRFPIITQVNKLSTDDLRRILTEPRNALVSQYEELLSMDNTQLKITEEAYDAICREAAEQHTGARGLRGIMERIMTGPMCVVAQYRNKRKPLVLEIGMEDIARSRLPISLQIEELLQQLEAQIKKRKKSA